MLIPERRTVARPKLSLRGVPTHDVATSDEVRTACEIAASPRRWLLATTISSFRPPADRRQLIADLPVEPHVGEVVELRRLRIENDHARARRFRGRHRRRDGVHLECGSDRDQAIGFPGYAHRALDD